jgi:hypothetical protein
VKREKSEKREALDYQDCQVSKVDQVKRVYLVKMVNLFVVHLDDRVSSVFPVKREMTVQLDWMEKKEYQVQREKMDQ